MFNQQKFQVALEKYKEDFNEYWPSEKYKWIAVQTFQDNWDVDAPDFVSMLEAALDKADNLLTSVNCFPKSMIIHFAKMNPEQVRMMFRYLFDESKDLYDRIEYFKKYSNWLLVEFFKEEASKKNHYQDENTITTYLWLRYPDKYYIYKFGIVKSNATFLEADYKFKKGKYEANVKNFMAFYGELRDALNQDESIVKILKDSIGLSNTTEAPCYLDDSLCTLTIDFCHYLDSYYTENDSYWPSLNEYDPGLTKEDWIKFLTDIEIANHPMPTRMLAAMMECGGEATPTILSQKYGETPQSYTACAVNLGRRAKKYFDLPACMDGDQERFFPVAFQGRHTSGMDEGYYSYRIRKELFDALKEVKLPVVSTVKAGPTNYWWLNANPKMWSFNDLAVGEEQEYTLYNENGNKRRIFQNFLDAKVGDLVIGYESKPVKKIVALARVSAEQDGETIWFEKVEGLSSPIEYKTLKACSELQNMEYFVNPQGSLFKMTEEEYDFILDIIREENPLASDDKKEAYDKKKFLSEVFMLENQYDSLVSILMNKKNIILQGAPGVGKTFAAKRLAYSIMGEIDEQRVEFIQFHQSYSYEDFIMGYKPTESGFELKEGIFYKFCQLAANHPDKEYFFIIDEINRGNMSKIFGELLMLIENDYRGAKATLAYNDMKFAVPRNLYIIGMMNTADRSLAMIDYALRRRFSFFEMSPGFNSEGFINYQKDLNSETFDELIDVIKELNETIKTDRSLGEGFCIGHSYFCNQLQITDRWINEVIEFDIIPTLKEYWFDEGSKVDAWSNKLRGVLNG